MQVKFAFGNSNNTMVFICMLRGINVSGQKKVPMAELKRLFESLGLKNVTTFIQSGNVVFKADNSNQNAIAYQIGKGIREQFGFEVLVLLRTPEELQKAAGNNPFLKEKGIDPERLYITFLEKEPAMDRLDKMKEIHFEPDRFVIIEREVFLYCPNGYGRTKLNNTFFESKLKVKATTRNWRTVNELLRIASEIN